MALNSRASIGYDGEIIQRKYPVCREANANAPGAIGNPGGRPSRAPSISRVTYNHINGALTRMVKACPCRLEPK